MTPQVLIVEDNLANLALMEYLLKAFGYTVRTATDGVRGLDAARREPPDVILMDLQMPMLDGFEALARLKQHPALRAIPVVAVTAFAMVGDRDKILARGFDGYIAKPIVPESFVDYIQAFIPAARRPPRPMTQPEGSVLAPPPRPRGQVVLIVDNSSVNRELVKVTLQPIGYQVEAAASVREALEIAAQRVPDLILSDIHMPRESGYDLIRLVRTDPRLRATRFMFISSTSAEEHERKTALALGADGFLLRPIEPLALIAAIETCMGQNGQHSRR